MNGVILLETLLVLVVAVKNTNIATERLHKTMSEILLEIKDLYASVEDKEIIKGLNLTIKKGEVL